MKQRKNKYNYIYVIQGNYGYGWEDLCGYDCSERDTLRHDFIQYALAEPNYSHRIIERRVLNK